MARNWLSISVELLGGRGHDPWPPPGRIFAAAPTHTFRQLADAINTAFARWDLNHISEFNLADGSLITDYESALEFAGESVGPIQIPVDIDRAKLGRTLSLGSEFQFVFDLGDFWAHRCVVHNTKIDPLLELGIIPDEPLPYWGWGSIPDQYGRRWASDDGESDPPKAPAGRDPMRWHNWAPTRQLSDSELNAIQEAVQAGDTRTILATLSGRSIDHALQELAPAARLLFTSRKDTDNAIALSLHNRLMIRGEVGDEDLAAELLQLFRARRPQKVTWTR